MSGGDINELHLFLGRVEGKLDLLISNQTSLGERIAGVETSVSKANDRLTVLETRRTFGRESLALIISIMAASAAAFGQLKGFFH